MPAQGHASKGGKAAVALFDRMKKDGQADIEAFWAEMAPCDHILQLYEDDGTFLDVLERFVTDGFKNGDSVVVIATAEHLNALTRRLAGFELAALEADDRYIPLDARETLSRFMVADWPDDALFRKTITRILGRARQNGRRVRAFGEMVALLWAQGDNGATIRLEHLWNNLMKVYTFSLFCAYPKGGFTEDAAESIERICARHSKMVPQAACGA